MPTQPNNTNTPKVTKAVFPVAGLGTRFLPATKATPKEMLPIVDKPLIQYAVEEAIEAGITELIFITSSKKQAIEDHFDSNHELESTLENKGRHELLSMVKNIIPPHVTCIYIRQSEQKGLGHAIACAHSILSNAPFAVLLADELITKKPGNTSSPQTTQTAQKTTGCLSQLMTLHAKTLGHVIGVQSVPDHEKHRYGIVSLAEKDPLNKIDAIVEKPTPNSVSSNYAAIGRYILLPSILKQLKIIEPGAGGELQLSDAIAELVKKEAFYAHVVQGHRYDCGSKIGYLQATVQYALQHPELGPEFKAYLLTLV